MPCILYILSSRTALGLRPLGRVRCASKGILHTTICPAMRCSRRAKLKIVSNIYIRIYIKYVFDIHFDLYVTCIFSFGPSATHVAFQEGINAGLALKEQIACARRANWPS